MVVSVGYLSSINKFMKYFRNQLGYEKYYRQTPSHQHHQPTTPTPASVIMTP
jgi:hypothetical protein